MCIIFNWAVGAVNLKSNITRVGLLLAFLTHSGLQHNKDRVVFVLCMQYILIGALGLLVITSKD